jgi:hypothetical protein
MPSTNQVNTIAVMKDPYNLAYVKEEDQNEAICMIAVKQKGNTIKYIVNQTESLCIEAVKNDQMAIKYVKNKTPYLLSIIDPQLLRELGYITKNIYESCENPNEPCMICFDIEGEWCKLSCGHIYHLNCITKCLQYNKCPYCQKNL